LLNVVLHDRPQINIWVFSPVRDYMHMIGGGSMWA
jgi:hypothetical protein